MDKFPCDNCLQANATCEVPESRRGKRARPSVSTTATSTVPVPPPSVPSPATALATAPVLATERRTSLTTQADQNGEVAAPGSISVNSRERRLVSPASSRPRTCGSSRLSTNSEINVATFQSPEASSSESELFLGESATLRCVYDDQTELAKHPSPKDNARLKFSVPQPIDSESAFPQWEAQRKERRIRYLREDGVFDMPPDALCSTLLELYFRWFHPCFPIVDRAEVARQWSAKALSPLLTMAMFSVAAAHGDDKMFADAGFVDRQSARYIFYDRAKDLYEVDYETSKTIVIQAVFLMSFWRSGRLLDKHTRHWLGIAITLAQSNAMHRCLPIRGSRQAKLRKRIWWSVYIRECQCSASLGLPVRIRDSDCDVEPLQLADMDDAPSQGQQPVLEILQEQSPAEVSYVVEMSRLAPLLSRIIDLEYSPHRTMDMSARNRLKEELFEWEDQLPKYLSPHARLGESLSLHAAMLHLAYNNLLILLFRNIYIHNGAGQDYAHGTIAVQAAARNSAVIEDILVRGLMRHADIHLINSLFNSLCIHVVYLRRSEGTTRSVTEHRARLCLLGLQELQKTWQVTIWALQLRLFFQALDKATTERLRVGEGEACPADEASNLATNILPPATSIFPELWGLGLSQSTPSDQLLSPDFNQLLADGEFSGIFGWTAGAGGIGLEELTRQPMQMDTDKDFSFLETSG